jgi:predicted TIM-barrel fold metal-dependent hydrolase
MSASAVGEYAGQLLDCDSHLYQDPDLMAEIVGDVGAGFVIELLRQWVGTPADLAARERSPQEIWKVKGISALGSTDTADRLTALDLLGIRAQLLFPNTALRELRVPGDAAQEACRRYNDYALQWSAGARGRARAVCQLNLSDPAWALAELDRVLASGARGVLLPCAQPPAGVAFAHETWDPMWARLEEADVPALIHIGSGGLVSSDADDPVFPLRDFANAPALQARFSDMPGAEERLGPWFVVVAHQAAELFLTALVMGGVLERFPRLRVGVIEFGAAWLGPMCERLDRHADLLAKVGEALPLKPSEYVRRNVRVTPFWSEPVDVLVDRYGLREAYVFSSDYPHVEGGRNPVPVFQVAADRVGTGFAREFFVDNAELLFPGLA